MADPPERRGGTVVWPSGRDRGTLLAGALLVEVVVAAWSALSGGGHLGARLGALGRVVPRPLGSGRSRGRAARPRTGPGGLRPRPATPGRGPPRRALPRCPVRAAPGPHTGRACRARRRGGVRS